MKKISKIPILLIFLSLLSIFGMSNVFAQVGKEIIDPTPIYPSFQSKTDPTPIPPYLEIGDMYLKSNMPEKAIEYYLLSLKSDPSNTEGLDKIEVALASISEIDKPNLSKMYIDIGDIYLTANRPEEALEYYLQSLVTDPINSLGLSKIEKIFQNPPSDPKLDIAEKYLEEGKYDEALDIYISLIEKYPNASDYVDYAESAIENKEDIAFTVINEIEEILITLFIWLVIIVMMLIITSFIKRILQIYQDLRSKRKTYIVLPFNSSQTAGKRGAENAVRNQFIEALLNFNELVYESNQFEIPELPDIGITGLKLADWLINFIWPKRKAIIIDGTLIEEHEHEFFDNSGYSRLMNVIGITIRIRNSINDQFKCVETFYFPEYPNPSRSTLNIGDYLSLTHQIAFWISFDIKISPYIASLFSASGHKAILGRIRNDDAFLDQAEALFTQAFSKEMTYLPLEDIGIDRISEMKDIDRRELLVDGFNNRGLKDRFSDLLPRKGSPIN